MTKCDLILKTYIVLRYTQIPASRGQHQSKNLSKRVTMPYKTAIGP